LIHPDDKSVAQAAVDAIRHATEARYTYEIQLRHADGSYRWVQTNGQVIERAADGRPIRLIGVRLDVTERKLAELERHQVLARITDGFVALDAHWHYTYVNQQAGELLGRDPASLIGKSAWDAFPPQPGETFHVVCRQAMADQKPARLEAYYPDLGRWIEDHIYPSSEGVSIYFRDVTQRKTTEIELRRAKEHAENVIANANVMIVGLNNAGQITLFNQAAQDLTGYSFSDLAGRNWFEVLVPRQRFPQVWADFERLSANGLPRQFENPILTITGQERLISWRNSPIHEGDQVVGTMSFGIDVTTRRQAELALAESKEQFEVLAQHSLQGIVLMRKAQVTYVNPAICAIAGRSAAELTRYSVAQLRQWVHPQDDAALIERRRQALQGVHAADQIEMRVQHASGQWRWIQSATRAITLGGEPALITMVVDIHERKVAEDALRNSEARFRSAFDSSGSGMGLTGMDGRWLQVNPSLCRIVGYTADELCQRTFMEITHPDDLATDLSHMDDLLAGRVPHFTMEKRYLHRNGHPVWVNLTVALVRNADGSPSHTVAQTEDISQRKQLELDLRGSQARLTATLDALPDLMFEVDLQGRYLDYHSPRTDLLVQAPQELIGRRVSDIMPPGAAATVIAGLHEAMSHGHSEGHLIELELPGGPHCFELSMALKATQPNEEPRFIVLSRDITDRIRTQHALRDSEELMRQMAESVSQMFWLFGIKENRYLYVSPAAQSVLGCTAASLLADPRAWQRNIHALDRDRFKAEQVGLMKTGTYDTEVRVWLPDGTLHWLHLRAYPIRGPDQTPYRLAGITEDITERKTLELREDQERDILQYLASGQPMAEILEKFVLAYESMLPGAKGSVLLMNPDGEHLRHGAAPHLPPAYCQAIDGIAIGPAVGSCGTAAFTGEPAVVADIATDPRWINYRALAATHQLQACWSVPIKGAQGQVLGTFAFYFDHVRSATPAELSSLARGAQLASQALERNLAVQALLESEERYRTLVEWSPEGIGVHQNGVMIYTNPAGAALLGARSALELIGKPMLDFVHPDDRADLQKNVEAILAHGEPTALTERRFLKIDGTVIDVETKGGSIVLNGAPAVQVIARDITARKQEQAALRESRQQLRVLSSRVLAAQEAERRRVAHELHDELGHTLTAIKINLHAEDRLTKGARSGLFAETIPIVEEALQHVRGLALALRPSMLDDLGLSPALRWLTQQTAARNPLQVQLHAPDALGRLDSDMETAVFRIVQEALTNIVRHAQASLAQVTVSVIDPGTLLVQVQDDGVGFDVPRVRQRATEGNSMGVLGMQERASLADAELSIVSNPGQGCTVTLRCPLRWAATAN
jgi:PAS domain S-box-containing protein